MDGLDLTKTALRIIVNLSTSGFIANGHDQSKKQVEQSQYRLKRCSTQHLIRGSG